MNELQGIKEASRRLLGLSEKERKKALEIIAKALMDEEILEANKLDLKEAKQASSAMQDRLRLDSKRLLAMSEGVLKVKDLPDKMGEVLETRRLESGLELEKRRVPLGVVGIIYEARPNVTSDAIALCIKSGNACVLKGGKEALRSNRAIISAIKKALCEHGLEVIAKGIVFIEDCSREAILALMKKREFIDVLIPRGGEGLIKSVIENASIPVIETGSGNCHIFVDRSVDFSLAKRVIINAKTSRPSVCNSAEKLLIHSAIADDFLVDMARELLDLQVELVVDSRALAILERAGISNIGLATHEDYKKEYLDYKMGIFILDDIKEAIEHINTYSSHHSEAILTSDMARAEQFLKEVDSAVVYVNASTRFSDGEEFGLGAEIGISTQKLHARGPMGIDVLSTYKYCIKGHGEVRG